MSEMGYLSTPDVKTNTNPRIVSEDAQAVMVGEMMAWIASGGLSPRVETFVWMTVEDGKTADGLGDPWPGGLKRSDGSRKPAWDAWADWRADQAPVPWEQVPA